MSAEIAENSLKTHWKRTENAQKVAETCTVGAAVDK